MIPPSPRPKLLTSRCLCDGKFLSSQQQGAAWAFLASPVFDTVCMDCGIDGEFSCEPHPKYMQGVAYTSAKVHCHSPLWHDQMFAVPAQSRWDAAGLIWEWTWYSQTLHAFTEPFMSGPNATAVSHIILVCTFIKCIFACCSWQSHASPTLFSLVASSVQADKLFKVACPSESSSRHRCRIQRSSAYTMNPSVYWCTAATANRILHCVALHVHARAIRVIKLR